MKRPTRERLKRASNGGGSYFAAPKANIQFIRSGCQLLDLALGGGWAEGRIANIVGDKSSGKTLLCIEAAANFALKHPKGHLMYREAEAAFDPDYARALGMPVDRIDFGEEPLETVEDLFEDIERCVSKAKTRPTLYICDSLDALSDRAELGREIDTGTYGAAKAKKMSELFRRLVRRMSSTNFTLIIVSQVRDKIGIRIGRKTTRTGGRALDFYSSQTLYLSQLGTIYKTIAKIKRPVGIRVKGKVDKNKVALPFREAEFEIKFGYGIDDQKASYDWLREIGTKADDIENSKELMNLVSKRWYEVEQTFLPTSKKYGGLADG